MKGHVRQRSKGTWSIVIDAGRDPETGKRHQQWHTIKGTKRDAERALREMLHSLETGAYVKPSRISVGEYLKQWCHSYAMMHTSPRTAESYQSEVHRHLIPALGAIPLCQLQPQQVQSYYAHALTKGRVDGKGGLSARTVLYQHRILSEALSHAVKMGLVVRNITKAVDPPRPKRTRFTTLSIDDIPKFLEAARQTPYCVLFSTALGTGMRLGELLGLRWCDVDPGSGSLYVVQSLYKRRRVCQFIEPKSAHSRRQIALPSSLTLLLHQHGAKQEAQRILLGKPSNGDSLVFAYADGRPLDPGTVTHAFARLLKEAGLAHIRFHDLRHTHATLMLKSDVHPKIVSERLGHASVAFTLDTYSHVVPGLQEAAAARFDRILEPDVSKMLAKESESSENLAEHEQFESEPPGTRTLNRLIKSQLLFRLS